MLDHVENPKQVFSRRGSYGMSSCQQMKRILSEWGNIRCQDKFGHNTCLLLRELILVTCKMHMFIFMGDMIHVILI